MTQAEKQAQKNYQLRFDELEKLISNEVTSGEIFNMVLADARRNFEDCLFWFFVDGYSSGVLMLDEDGLLNMQNGYEFLNITYPDGQTVLQKFEEHYLNGDAKKMAVLFESESHRMYNVGSLQSAQDALYAYGGKVMKTWHGMLDDRERDEHWMLEGKTIPFNEEFVTSDGDYGMAPGQFQTAENNANCRCWLTYKRVNA